MSMNDDDDDEEDDEDWDDMDTGTGCTYPTIADAVAAAAANGTASDLILVKTSPTQIISAPITLDLNVAGTVEIVGGFGTCTDALPIAGQRTTLSVPSSAAFTVQNPGGSSRTLTLQQVALIGSASGRLLDVSGRVLVNIDDALLSNGKGTDGGNIRLAGANVTLLIQNGSAIYSGDATGNGGGVHCSGGGFIGLVDGGITDNQADGSGGGVYLDSCDMNVFVGGGSVSCPSGSNRGITCNVAGAGAGSGSGGGVYATNGAVVSFLGSSSGPASLTLNRADYGGGLFLTGAASAAEFRDAEIRENAGLLGGGGVAADNGAQLTIHATITNCANPAGCSRVVDNYTASAVGELSPGGGVWVTGGADASIRRSTFRGNSAAHVGSAIAVEGAGSTALFEGNAVYQNPLPFYVFAGGNLTAAFVTAWGNTVGSSGTFSATGTGSNIAVYSSVTLDSKTFGGLGPGATYSGDCIVTRSLTDFPPPPDPGSFELVASEGGGPPLAGDRESPPAQRFARHRLLRHLPLHADRQRSRRRGPRLRRSDDPQPAFRSLRPGRRRVEAALPGRLRARHLRAVVSEHRRLLTA